MNKHPYLFTSDEASIALSAVYDDAERRKQFGVSWPDSFTTLKRLKAPPVYAGWSWVVQACPGEGKTALKDWWVRQINQAIVRTNSNAVVINGVLEQSIEQSRAGSMSRTVDYRKVVDREITKDELNLAIVESASDQIRYVGPSQMGEIIHPDAAQFQTLHPRDLGHYAYSIRTEEKLDIAGCAIDYLQLMSDDNNSSKMYDKVTNVSQQLIMLIRNTLKCPTLVCAQSDLKGVKGRNFKIPEKADIQHSSQITQDADIIWSLWKPSADYPLYATVPISGYEIPIFKDLVVVKVVKWRNANALDGETFVLSFGNPFGHFREVDLSLLSKVDRSKASADKISMSYDLQEFHFGSRMF